MPPEPPTIMLLLILYAPLFFNTPPLMVTALVPSAKAFPITFVPALIVTPPPKLLEALKVSVPLPLFVMPKEAPLMLPPAVRVLPALTFQAWLAPSAIEALMVMLFAAEERSMPLEPKMNVPEPGAAIMGSAVTA